MSAYRVSVKGSFRTYHNQYRSQEEAQDLYNAYVNGPFQYLWETVTLAMWIEGAGMWHTISERKLDWHASPLTHSYA